MTEQKIKQKKQYPRKARYGTANGKFKHGGYVLNLLNDEEREYYERRKKEYLNAYSYLESEPPMLRMLHELILTEILMDRLNNFIMDPHIPLAESVAAGKRLDSLRRTYSLYLARMGITYQSRERRKVRKERRTALEAAEEAETPDFAEINRPLPCFIWKCECGKFNAAIRPPFVCKQCEKSCNALRR